MYKVYFCDVLFASANTIEDACTLGLAVHRSSNNPHVVKIQNPDESELLSFTLKQSMPWKKGLN